MLAIQDPETPFETTDRWGQLFKLRSTFHAVDDLYYFTLVVCIFFFLLITGILAWSVVKYRRKTIDQPAASNVTHHTLLEVVWTVVPLIIVMVIFAWGWYGSFDMTMTPRGDARRYTVTGQQWSWTFHYPNDPVTSTNELWLEVDKPAVFNLVSTDVLHSFFVPSMRVKRDVVPGRINKVWFQPTDIGDYHLFCAEYCGKDHSTMHATIHVVGAEKYKTRPWDTWDPNDMVGNGEKIWRTQCASCHSLDGTRLVGPSWQGMFIKQADGTIVGREEQLADGGTVTVDADYIKESIREPNAKVVATFTPGQMTAFDTSLLPDFKIEAIVAFMQSERLLGAPK